tara:strand:- start:1560 stop:2177 length:618 start_codon:yes stop_codon:yes gene_type:complete
VDILELLYKKHNDWLNITESFGVNSETAKDIVSELYYKIKELSNSNKDCSIMFNDNEVNYYFIYVTLRNLAFDLKRKEKNISIISLDSKYMSHLSDEMEFQDWDKKESNESDLFLKHKVISDWYENDKYLQMLEEANLLENYSKDKMKVYYMRRIFKEVFLDKTKVSELSRNTNITYWSLRNTIKNIKKQIKEDYEFRRHIRDDF